jgi:DNA mismatch repair protein MutS2
MCCVASFTVVSVQVPYSGFGLMSRVVLTIAFSRVLRIACFMTTVLPNPVPNCYNRRFPPVPRDAWAVIKAGYTHIRGFGGCNDLIFR